MTTMRPHHVVASLLIVGSGGDRGGLGSPRGERRRLRSTGQGIDAGREGIYIGRQGIDAWPPRNRPRPGTRDTRCPLRRRP